MLLLNFTAYLRRDKTRQNFAKKEAIISIGLSRANESIHMTFHRRELSEASQSVSVMVLIGAIVGGLPGSGH